MFLGTIIINTIIRHAFLILKTDHSLFPFLVTKVEFTVEGKDGQAAYTAKRNLINECKIVPNLLFLWQRTFLS